jgi:hypothetical protein
VLRGGLLSLDIDRVLGRQPLPESETYRLARLLWTLLVGRDPFIDAATDVQQPARVFERQLAGRCASLANLRHDVPGDLAVFIDASLAVDWAARPGPPVVFADALATFRARFDDGGAPGLARLVCSWFAAEHRHDLRVAEDAALVDVDAFDPGLPRVAYTPLEPCEPPGPRESRRPAAIEVQGAARAMDGKPMVLVPPHLFVDATLVSNESWAVFASAVRRWPTGAGPRPCQAPRISRSSASRPKTPTPTRLSFTSACPPRKSGAATPAWC